MLFINYLSIAQKFIYISCDVVTKKVIKRQLAVQEVLSCPFVAQKHEAGQCACSTAP